jgi:hypothetical protein
MGSSKPDKAILTDFDSLDFLSDRRRPSSVRIQVKSCKCRNSRINPWN